MASYTENFTEVHQVLAHEPADSQTAEVNSGYVDVGDFHRIVVIISVGDIAATGTFDVLIQQATDTAGTSSKSLSPSKASTQLTQAGGDSDDLIIFDFPCSELDVTNSFDCVNVRVSPGTAATEFSMIVLGACPRFPPVSTTLVTEIIT
jgi:hypothetical protein